MTMQEATFLLLKKLRGIYSEGEASHITDWVMEHLTGSTKTERMLYKNEAITAKEEQQMQQYLKRLLLHEPVQYVLNEAFFCGFRLYVDKQVLIPRPETEELVEWIIADRSANDQLSLLDIGSGSGCIPVALKKKLATANIWSCDISPSALEVARRNAATLQAEINFIELDFLQEEQRNRLPLFDVIVSNPPYIPHNEKKEMEANVLDHEPAIALFVPDSDALVFYKAIAEFGKTHVSRKGAIYAEINESLGEATVSLFREYGYTVQLKKDMQGKDRMIRAM